MNSTFTKILICFFICVSSAKQINAQCLANETQIVISITTDNYPGETSWQLLDQNGAGFVNANPLTQSFATLGTSVFQQLIVIVLQFLILSVMVFVVHGEADHTM